jgi:hypothetical protein
MRVGAGEIDYPVPWASDAEASFVAEPQTYRRLLAEAGFRVKHERDRRAFGIEFFSRMRTSPTQGPPPLGPHIVIGHDFATKVANLVEAMQRGLLVPTEMISTATGGSPPETAAILMVDLDLFCVNADRPCVRVLILAESGLSRVNVEEIPSVRTAARTL